MSISKVSKSKFNIVRRPDYARKDVENITEVEISNKDSRLDNKTFNDFIMYSNDEKEPKKEEPKKVQRDNEDKKQNGQTKNKDGLTDFYV
jgi:hypothetical protein